MKKFFLLSGFIFLFCSFAGEYRLVKSIPFENGWLTTDKLGNAYVIALNQVFKFDADGKPAAHYSEINSGRLRTVDASDPMKVVLYYPDFSRVITLNNKLALQSTIELRSLGFVYPTLISPSANLGYWVYDISSYQLKKIDPSLQVVYESGNLQQITGITLKPTILVEAENYVYLSDPVNGIFVFNMYGVYYKTIPVKDLKSLQVIGNNLYYVRENSFYSYDQKKIEETEIKIPPHDSLFSARIEQNRLYLLTSTTLSVYSF